MSPLHVNVTYWPDQLVLKRLHIADASYTSKYTIGARRKCKSLDGVRLVKMYHTKLRHMLEQLEQAPVE